MHRIFLCHSGNDKPFVRRLCTDLRQYGLECWIDETEIKVGESIREKIEEGISRSDYLAIILSNNSIASPWVAKELDAAFIRQTRQRGVFILPVLIETCQIPPLISGLKYADFRTSYSAGIADILTTILGPSTPTPALVAKSASIQSLMEELAAKSNLSDMALRRLGEFVVALGLTQDERDIFTSIFSPAVRRSMTNENASIREAAAYVAGVLRDRGSIPALEKLLTDTATETHEWSGGDEEEEDLYHVRIRAVQSLLKIDPVIYKDLPYKTIGLKTWKYESTVSEVFRILRYVERFGSI